MSTIWKNTTLGLKVSILAILITIFLFIITAIIIIILIFVSQDQHKENIAQQKKFYKDQLIHNFDIDDIKTSPNEESQYFILNYSNNLSFVTQKDAMLACKDLNAKIISKKDIPHITDLVDKYKDQISRYWIQSENENSQLQLQLDNENNIVKIEKLYEPGATICFGIKPETFGIFA